VPKYVIERDIPGIGKKSPREIQEISRKSNSVVTEVGRKLQWVESFVTDDKLYCVYISPDEQAIRDHASHGGFPANRISQVRRMMDPTSGEETKS